MELGDGLPQGFSLWRFPKYFLRWDLLVAEHARKTGISMDGWIHIIISRTNIYIDASLEMVF